MSGMLGVSLRGGAIFIGSRLILFISRMASGAPRHRNGHAMRLGPGGGLATLHRNNPTHQLHNGGWLTLVRLRVLGGAAPHLCIVAA